MMGRGNKKKYYKDLHQQAHEKLTSMLNAGVGTSKVDAIADGTAVDKIFSYNTYHTYKKHINYFTRWINENYSECTTLKSARKHANEWLQSRVDQGLSAYTIHTEAKALGKLYGITPDDKNYFHAPKRLRENITRSRVDTVRDKHFSKANNDELIKFCQGTGLRRSELENLRGSDLVTKQQIEDGIKLLESKSELSEQEKGYLKIMQDATRFDSENFVFVKNGKGGKQRISPVISKFEQQIVDRIKDTPDDKKVWQFVNKNADIHSYRSDYATNLYRLRAREIADIPYDKQDKAGRMYQSEVYICRKDEAGKRLDRSAMLDCSKALGHNRVDVVANNYIRGL